MRESPWKPISDAPHDGRWLLVKFPTMTSAAQNMVVVRWMIFTRREYVRIEEDLYKAVDFKTEGWSDEHKFLWEKRSDESESIWDFGPIKYMLIPE